MKMKFKKRIYISTLAIFLTGTLAATTIILSPSLSLNSSNNTISNISSKLNSTSISTQADTKTSAYLQPWNWQKNTNNLKSPIQNMAFNSSNTNYALLTTTTNTYNSSKNSVDEESVTQNYDSLTNYSMSDGTKKWSKKASEINLSSTNKDSNQGQYFLAVSYLNSYLSRPGYFLTIINDSDSKLYFAILDESEGNLVFSKELTTNKMTLNNTTATDQYYINVNSSSLIDINIYKITSSDSSISILTYNYTPKSNFSTISTSTEFNVNTYSKTINSNLLGSYFYDAKNALNSKIASAYTLNNYIYFVFQHETITNDGWNKNFVTILRISPSDINSDITSEQLYSLSLTSDEAKAFADTSKRPNVSIAKNGSTFTVVLSSSQTSNYLYSNVTEEMFSSSITGSFKSLSFSDKAYIININNLYDVNDTSTSNSQGYIALLNNNKVVKISSDFSSATLLYDFSTLNVNNTSKLVFNVFTIPGDANWYGQLADGSIIEFNGSNLIGQLGSDSVKNRTENVASITLLDQNEINSNVLFQKVSQDGTSSDQSFNTYISNNASSFFSIDSYDTVFGSPWFTAKTNSITKDSDGNYKVSITFSQNLRKITNGIIDNATTTSVALATNVYTFTNANSNITIVDKSNVSASITSKLPSEVTESDLASVLDLKNFGNYTLTLEPNNTEGSLTVQIKSDAVWVEGELKTNYIQTVKIGSSDKPYFKIDVLNGLSSTVDLVTDDYLKENATLKTTLTNKYSTTLPSNITAQNIIDDFLVFGDAFSSTQLTSSGLIQKPTTDNVKLYPIDSEGKIYVSVTIPRIGDQTNVTYSFTTASIFQKNFTTNENVYLSFKSNSSALNSTYTTGSGNSTTTVSLSTLTPSTIAGLINNDKTLLFSFIDMSNYVYNILANLTTDSSSLATLSIASSDPLGTLTFTIKFNQTIPGLDSSYTCVFTNFTTSNTNLSGAPTNMPGFNWGTMDSTALSGKKPSDITADYLETNFSTLFVYTNGADQLTHDISVTPLSGSGAILVTITFYNWWEKVTTNGATTSTKLLQKTFSTVITNGLSKSQDSINSIIWKSFYELSVSNSAYTSGTASNAVSLINSSASTDIDKLQLLANVSDYMLANLKTALASDPGALSISIVPDDDSGTLSMYATIKLNGTTYSTNTTLSGFNLSGADYSVSLAQESSETAQALKSYVPSNLTSEQISSLINVSIGNGLQKDVQVAYDDVNGTLTLTVGLYKDNTLVASTARTYSGFAKSTINYNGTNILITIAAVIIPVILLLTPILYLSLFKNRRDIKKLSKVLDKRLTDQATHKKTTEVNTIADLLNLETDKKW